MYNKIFLVCIHISLAGLFSIPGMILGYILAFFVYLLFRFLGISDSYVDPIGYALEAILGLIFLIGGWNITTKPLQLLARLLN